ncbi:MAG: hypothetical protein JSV42_17660 [Chloroflexota bacterium]|nr:MAG: hypothetical protein JSV42_17660 [Chloroflexota bacterium]
MVRRVIVQQTSAGEPIQVGELNVYPISRSYRIEFPKASGGIIWNKPLAVIVEDKSRNRQVIPIIDYTRRIQITLLLAGFFGTILTWLIFKGNKSSP